MRTSLTSRANFMIGIATKSGNAFHIMVLGTPKGDLYATISNHLDKAIRYKSTIDVPGGQVLAVCRQLDEDGKLTWVLHSSESVALDSAEVRQKLKDELGPVAEETRTPLPW